LLKVFIEAHERIAHEPIVTLDALHRPPRTRSAARHPRSRGEPRIIFGEDDGTRINDRLARYLVESLNAGLDVEDPNPDEGWFLDGLEEGNEQDPAILICDPDFEIRLEILNTGSLEEDQALGRKVVALINTYLIQNEVLHPSAAVVGSSPKRQQTGS
jgi:hypothetical protein